jgi:hypothetical protein
MTSRIGKEPSPAERERQQILDQANSEIAHARRLTLARRRLHFVEGLADHHLKEGRE